MGEHGQGDPVEIRFQRKCSAPTENGCIEWLGARDKNGYGRIKPKNSKRIKAHRFSYQQAFGVIPDGYCVCHKCDNPPCVNPQHLFLGTRQDNTKDMHRKGRAVFNMKGLPMKMLPNSKLSKEDVLEIRRLLDSGMKQVDIVKKFKIHRSTVLQIKKRFTWYHI